MLFPSLHFLKIVMWVICLQLWRRLGLCHFARSINICTPDISFTTSTEISYTGHFFVDPCLEAWWCSSPRFRPASRYSRHEAGAPSWTLELKLKLHSVSFELSTYRPFSASSHDVHLKGLPSFAVALATEYQSHEITACSICPWLSP